MPSRTLLICLLLSAKFCQGEPVGIQWDRLEITEQRALHPELQADAVVCLRAGAPDTNHAYAWVTFRIPKTAADLSAFAELSSTLTNHSGESVETMLWVAGTNGWSAVGDFAKLQPGESRKFSVDLFEAYPDKTPKIDPAAVDRIQVMVRGVTNDLDLEVGPITMSGSGAERNISTDRVLVPLLEEGDPAPGKRVKYRLPGDEASDLYGVLYLPPTWNQGGRYPVIVEYPGNIFFNAKCYSTGRPEQCVIGYGMTKGEGAIILSLPFVDRAADAIVESGFGRVADTLSYTKQSVEAVIEQFGGDRENMVLTGFSRGSIASGFIGLRDEEIAAYWKGIHGCQHYDGSAWRESTMVEAVERAKRFRGRAIFQTDNSAEKYAPVVSATRPEVEWTWLDSGLGFHSTAMFLDDRPSTVQLREWYQSLIVSP